MDGKGVFPGGIKLKNSETVLHINIHTPTDGNVLAAVSVPLQTEFN
jgi:hypothetical protein